MIPYNYKNPNSAKYVKRTWGKHCNVLLFVSGDVDGELEPYVPVANSTDTWTMVHKGLIHAFQMFGDKADWFLRAEDYNFVVLENLRYMIDHKKYLPTQPIYFGYELENIYTHEPFIFFKSGYVLSHEALKRYTDLSKDLQNEHCVHMEGFTEDVELQRCLSYVNVTTVDCRDELGHETFSPIPMDYHFMEGYSFIPWLKNLSFKKVEEETVPLSSRAISFRVQYPPEMYDYYYFVYKMRIFGQFLPNSVEFQPQ
ncbi:hypothetical protein KR067_003390 [Drosophila pandora]|nr:hypothetical protein KR067_003390 [Drosophila pandora]